MKHVMVSLAVLLGSSRVVFAQVTYLQTVRYLENEGLTSQENGAPPRVDHYALPDSGDVNESRYDYYSLNNGPPPGWGNATSGQESSLGSGMITANLTGRAQGLLNLGGGFIGGTSARSYFMSRFSIGAPLYMELSGQHSLTFGASSTLTFYGEQEIKLMRVGGGTVFSRLIVRESSPGATAPFFVNGAIPAGEYILLVRSEARTSASLSFGESLAISSMNVQLVIPAIGCVTPFGFGALGLASRRTRRRV